MKELQNTTDSYPLFSKQRQKQSNFLHLENIQKYSNPCLTALEASQWHFWETLVLILSVKKLPFVLIPKPWAFFLPFTR